MNPSFHRAIAHSEEFAQYYHGEGFTIGEMSETAQEAINCPTKKDVAFFSYRGSHKSQNLQCFQRNWAFADPFTLEFAEWKNKNSFLLTHVDMLPDHMIQGVFFNWRSPKINKYGEKLKYQNWCPPKRYQFCWHLILDILVVDNGGYYVPVVATGGFSDAPGSIYRSILSSCSYYWKIFTTGAYYLTTGTLWHWRDGLLWNVRQVHWKILLWFYCVKPS